MIKPILLDVAPDPVVGIGALIALGILIVGVVTILIVAFVFVLSRRKQRNANTGSVGNNRVPQPNSSE